MKLDKAVANKMCAHVMMVGLLQRELTAQTMVMFFVQAVRQEKLFHPVVVKNVKQVKQLMDSI